MGERSSRNVFLWSIKITPHVTDIVEVAKAVKRSGCDALTASNSIQALMGIDIKSFAPYLALEASPHTAV